MPLGLKSLAIIPFSEAFNMWKSGKQEIRVKSVGCTNGVFFIDAVEGIGLCEPR